MPVSMTPLETELVYKFLPLPKERSEWKKRIEEIDNESERVQIMRALYKVLDKNYGKCLEGVIEKKDAFKRLNGLYSISLLPESVGVDKKTVTNVINDPYYEKKVHEILRKGLERIIPNIGDIKSISALSNADYLQNLFQYHNYYSKTGNHLEIFRMIQKAFLEEGSEGVKKLKYHSKEFRGILPDDDIRSFAEKIDERIGEVSTLSKGDHSVFESLEEKFNDFANHSKNENLEDIEEAGKELEKLKPRLEKALANMNDARLSEKIKKAVEEKNDEELKKELEALKKQKFQGLKERNRNFLIGVLTREGNLSNMEAVSNSVKLGKEVVEELKNLKGKPVEKQESMLRQIREKYGVEKLDKVASTLKAFKNSTFQDLNYFLSVVINPPQKKEGNVTSHVTHDATELFTLGKFENNCQSPGTRQSESLLGFAIHPSELVIGHYLNDEFIGFTFAHFLKSNNNYAILFERPYSNHSTLKNAMQKNIEKIKEKINEAAKNEKIPLTAVFKNELKGDYKVLNSPYVRKYYDCKPGEVSGGERI